MSGWKTAEQQRAYRAKRPGATAAYQKAYYKRHPERVKAANRRQYDRSRNFINELKSAPCMDCNVSYPTYVMDFDHRDPSTKRFEICSSSRYAQIKTEAAKCDVVCSNCHRERTFGPLKRDGKKSRPA